MKRAALVSICLLFAASVAASEVRVSLAHSTFVPGSIAVSRALPRDGGLLLLGSAVFDAGVFPSARRFGPLGYDDLVVAQTDARGRVEWIDFIGGGAHEMASRALAVAPDGTILAGGTTFSNDFPTAHAMKSTLSGNTDGVLIRLSADGATLLEATCVGEAFDDHVDALAVAGDGSVTLAGETSSSGWPAALDAYGGGQSDAFVAHLPASLAQIDWFRYVGGRDLFGERATDVLCDAAANVYLVATVSSAIPVTSGAQTRSPVGEDDVFIQKMDASGRILFATYLGGTKSDAASAAALDDEQNLYLVGTTASRDFPNNMATNRSRSYPEGFLVKLDANGRRVFSDLIRADAAQSLARDAHGRIWVTGLTVTRGDLDVTPDALQSDRAGDFDAFVELYSADGALLYATYWGGSDAESAPADVATAGESVWISGQTQSADFPVTPDAPVAAHEGGASFLTNLSIREAGYPAFVPADLTVPENGGPALLQVQRVGGADGPMTVAWSTHDGDATAPSDYTAVSGLVSFADGEATPKTIAIPIVNDAIPEPTESFTVRFDTWTGGAPLASEARVTILDDDTGAGDPATVRSKTLFNPSRGERAEIHGATEAAGGIETTIFDRFGERVATLHAEGAAGADYVVIWDGRTDRGSLAAPGVYRAVLDGPSGRRQVPLILID